MALPTAYMDEPVEVAAPISEGDLIRLIDSQTTPVEEETEEPEIVGTGTPSEPGVPPTGEEPTPLPPTPIPLITICHMGKTTMQIDPGSLQGHLNHGDTEGPCP
jgi:hypothetical protein